MAKETLKERFNRIRKHNKSKSNFESEFESKILRDGNNKMRCVDDDVVMLYEHWFTAADGTRVHSICTRNYDHEIDDAEHEIEYCRVCGVVKDSWDIWNDSGDYSDEEVSQAALIIGKEDDKAVGFPNSWGGKLIAHLNVIDRDDDWCAEHNHTKALAKSEKSAGISGGDGGIFDEFIDVVDDYGDWKDYDIRVKKQGKKKSTSYRATKDKEYELTEGYKDLKSNTYTS